MSSISGIRTEQWRTAPRGMRWWWTALTGEELDGTPDPARTASAAEPAQLSLDDVNEGYGG
jgi:hypothetical protein